jgi:hypothetical protein
MTGHFYHTLMTMDANGWSAIAAACSAAAAALSLAVAWNAKGIQGRSADFANCIEVVEQLGNAQRRVFNARDDNERYEFEFRELLNLLEALALLYNDGRIAASTKRFTGKFLDEALAWINIDHGMATLMRKSITGDETYHELKNFEKRRKPKIRSLSRFYRAKRDVQQ